MNIHTLASVDTTPLVDEERERSILAEFEAKVAVLNATTEQDRIEGAFFDFDTRGTQ